MLKKLLPVFAFSVLGTSALANGWDIEAGFENQRFDDSAGGFEFFAGALTAGYRWDYDSDTSGTLEGTVTFGAGSDRLTVIVADLNTYIGLGYRQTQQLNEDWSVFGRVAYGVTGLDLTIENLGDNEVGTDLDGFGFGAGVAWRGVTLGYTLYTGDLQDYSAISLGYRWRL